MGSEHTYRLKPVVVEAMQITGQNIEEVAAWCGGRAVYEYNLPVVVVPTDGNAHATPGDWIVKQDGATRRCKADAFEAAYELVEATDSPRA